MKKKPLYGKGINDADYLVAPRVNGKTKWCPYFRRWVDMLRRCYCAKYHEKTPTYKDCSVCDEWLTFSNFRAWMADKDWKGKHLDKDLLFRGNKVYSPESCVFVDPATNLFTTDRSSCRGELPLGVYRRSSSGKLRAHCMNPFTGKRESLGTFVDPDKAHQAWKRRKHELACQWADTVSDSRLAAALRSRYK